MRDIQLQTLRGTISSLVRVMPKLWTRLYPLLKGMAEVRGADKQDLHHAAANILASLLPVTPSTEAGTSPSLRSCGVLWEAAADRDGRAALPSGKAALDVLQALIHHISAPDVRASQLIAASLCSASVTELSGAATENWVSNAAGAACDIVTAFCGAVAWVADGGGGGAACAQAKLVRLALWVQGLHCEAWRCALFAALLTMAQRHSGTCEGMVAMDYSPAAPCKALAAACITLVSESEQCTQLCSLISEVSVE